jgi:hypothetical protein
MAVRSLVAISTLITIIMYSTSIYIMIVIKVEMARPLDRCTPNWHHFVQGGIAINSGYITIVIKVKMAARRHLDFAIILL